MIARVSSIIEVAMFRGFPRDQSDVSFGPIYEYSSTAVFAVRPKGVCIFEPLTTVFEPIHVTPSVRCLSDKPLTHTAGLTDKPESEASLDGVGDELSTLCLCPQVHPVVHQDVLPQPPHLPELVTTHAHQFFVRIVADQPVAASA